MKQFRLFGYLIEIRKKNEKAPDVTGSTKTPFPETTRFPAYIPNDAPQLLKDAYKCSICENKTCLCPQIAKYILLVGVDEFNHQAQEGSFPEKIANGVHDMDMSTLFAYTKPCDKYENILETAIPGWHF